MKYGNDLWNISTLSKFIQENQENESDWSMAVTGRKGVGKSTLAYGVCKNTDRRFSPQRNIIMTPSAEGIADRLEKLEPDSTVSVDESIGALYSENWAKEEQKGLHQYLAQCQRKDKHTATFFCLPSIYDLRGPLRRAGVNMWIRVYQRGEAALLLPSAVEENDPFRLDEIVKVRRKLEKELGRTKTYQQYAPEFQRALYRRLSTFLAILTFPPMSPTEKLDYENYFRTQRESLKSASFKNSASQSSVEEARQLRIYEKKLKLESRVGKRIAFCGCVWEGGKQISYCKGHAKYKLEVDPDGGTGGPE